MGGTQPFTEFGTQTVVRLTAGLSKTPLLRFPWGAPAEPVTVGVRGDWAVLADGLLDTHVYLGFDGRQLLIALASADAKVMLNGQPLQTRGWFQVPVPGHIQLAGGELRVEYEGAAPNLLQGVAPSPEIETLFDGGVLRERARVMAEQAPPFAQPSSPPGAPGKRETPWAPHNAAVAPAAPISAGPSDHAQRMLASSPPPGAPASGPVPEVSRGFWREASGPKKLIVLLMPFALASTFWVIWDDDGAEVGPSPTPKAPVSVAVTTSAPSASAEVGVAPRLAHTPPGPPTASAPEASAAAVESAAAATASAARPSAPTPTAPTPSAATPSAAAPSAAASTTAKPDGANADVTKPVPDTKGYSPHTALNAAFLGDWSEATKQYATLASANPDNEAFRLAARLTADHAVRRP